MAKMGRVVLTTAQAGSLAKVARKHEGELVYVFQEEEGYIDIELSFPHWYRIMHDGHIVTEPYTPVPDTVKPFKGR